MSRILVIEDELDMLRGLKDNLEFDGYMVDIAQAGEEGLKKIIAGEYDLIILDIMLPDISGFDICKKVRGKSIKIPIILLTAKSEEIDKVRGLELGADDYITKPFSLGELLARVKAVLRRTRSEGDKNFSTYSTIGNLAVNFRSYEAKVNDEHVKMSVKEIDILKLLIERKNETVDRDELLAKVWGIENDITTRTVDNFIYKLRKKVENDPANPKHILTVHGIGYKLV